MKGGISCHEHIGTIHATKKRVPMRKGGLEGGRRPIPARDAGKENTLAYIPLTDEQKLKAATIDLPAFLEKQNLKLKRSGGEFRLESDPYITIRGNQWYDQAEQRGGNPISLVRRLYGLNFPEAVIMLLEGEIGAPNIPSARSVQKEKKPFALPEKNHSMRRVYAYLIKQRQIPANIISSFAKAGMIYESAERQHKSGKVYHNAIFVGCDKHGVPRHAHKHGLSSMGRSYKGNVAGSEPGYSFCHIGVSCHLYVFEAPIDMLSFIAMYPSDWQAHNYVALCGVADHAMMQCLSANPTITNVHMCLDNDERGLDAAKRLVAKLTQHDDVAGDILLPDGKDWNIDLQHQHDAGSEYCADRINTAISKYPSHSMQEH